MTDRPGPRPLDLAARAAYGAFALSSADRLGEMPPWEAIPPEARADWRAVADAVLTVTQMGTGAGRDLLAAYHELYNLWWNKTGTVEIDLPGYNGISYDETSALDDAAEVIAGLLRQDGTGGSG